MRPARILAAGALASALAFPAFAANLVLGLSADVTAIDPHYHNLTPNNNVAQHLFDYLVMRNEKSQAIPGLATEWKAVEPTVWDLTTCFRWTKHFLTPLDAPIPETSIVHATLAGFPGIAGVVAKRHRGTPFLVTDHGVFVRERYIAVSANLSRSVGTWP